MNEVTQEQLLEILQLLGVQPGDGLLVHSALQFLGRPAGGIEMYYQALYESVSLKPSRLQPYGTIAVPTFNFSFARGEAYDPNSAPADGMGALSEYIRQLPEARRTRHPLQSLAVVGRYAEDLAQRDTPSAFDPGSAFDRMVELNFKILLLGADIDAVSLIHYSEQRMNVPYRYWKDFSGLINTPTGWEERTYRMYARDMTIDPKLTLHPVRDELIKQGKYLSMTLNYGQISLVRMSDLIPMIDRFLAEDPYSLMINRPNL